MKKLWIVLIVLMFCPLALAQDEGGAEEPEPEPEPEPQIEMIAGSFECFEYPAGTVNARFTIGGSTISSQALCETEGEQTRRSCQSMREDILGLMGGDETICSTHVDNDDFAGHALFNGSFVCRGTRNQIVNLAADLCEWAYLH